MCPLPLVRIPVNVGRDSIGAGHLIPFDVGSHSVVMWAAFFVLP
jgi:hypothetical protein